MTVSIAYNPGFIAYDDNGNPLSGGKVYTYAAGTTTPKVTYTDSTGLVANANPVILDSSGYASIWIDGTYKFVIHDANNVLIRTIDNYTNDRGATGAAGTFQMATAAGTVDAITANYTPDISLADNATVGFVSLGANTITNPTFAPDGLTARTIVKNGGQALAAGDTGVAGSIRFVTYNLANTRWELVNPAGSTSTSYKSVLGADVAMSVSNTYYDAVSVAQGTTGTFLVTGQVTTLEGTGSTFHHAVITDGTTTYASGADYLVSSGYATTIGLSTLVTNPAGNLRLRARSVSTTGGVIKFNQTGSSTDTQLVVVRIA